MPLSPAPHVRGLLLAAGAGRRFGGPKALARQMEQGPTLVEVTVGVLRDGGCDGVTVVVGAAADDVARVLAPLLSRPGPQHDVDLIVCPDWAEGMGASLRAGLQALAAQTSAQTRVEAAVVTLVDLPDVGPDVVARLLAHLPVSDQPVAHAHAAEDPGGPEGSPPHEGRWRAALARAAYGGVPGHPALIGRDHWEGIIAGATGDRGARAYYRTRAHDLIECGDLATGRDADRPEQLEELRGAQDGEVPVEPARSE